MNLRVTILSLIYILILSGCSGIQNTSSDNNIISSNDLEDFNLPVYIKYAKGFSVYNGDGYKRVAILNPDNMLDTIELYMLYPKGQKPIDSIIGNAMPIAVPINNVACLSTTTVGMIPLLGLNDRLVGIGNLGYVYNTDIRARIDSGNITELGVGMNKSIEQIAMLHPDVLIQDVSKKEDKDNDLIKSGISIVSVNNWKESDLLARAEWIKIMSMLFCKNSKADSLFNHIVEEYNNAKDEVVGIQDTVKVIWGQAYQGTWYVPGEYSYVTSMLNDAGCKFEYEPNTNISTPYNLETIFARHRNDSIWFCQASPTITDIASLLESNTRYKDFNAISKGKVFVDRKRTSVGGGNDIWESGLYRPDLLLKDIVKISHPELLTDYELTYWYQLK